MTPQQKSIIRAYPRAFPHLARLSGVSCVNTSKSTGGGAGKRKKITKIKSPHS